MEIFELILQALALVIACLFVAIVVMAKRHLRRDTNKKITELFPLLRKLVYWFDSNGVLVFTHKSTEYFIQFSRYQLSDDDFGISFDFPVTTWSEPFVKGLKLSIDKHKLIFTEDHDLIFNDKSLEANGLYFICIDFGKNARLASNFSYDIFTTVFGLSPNAEVKIKGFKGGK